MALIMNKDVGLHAIVEQAYVRIENVMLNLSKKELTYTIATYLSKEARELAVMREYILAWEQQHGYEKKAPKEGQLEELGITQEQWDSYTAIGPWDYDERKWLESKLLLWGGQAAQSFSYTESYDGPADINAILSSLYTRIKNKEDNFPVFFSIPGREVVIEDDLDSAADIISRWVDMYPQLKRP